MAETYEDYKQHVIHDIEACLENLPCQPILFIGSGFSRRYIGGPNWDELLQKMAEVCPRITKSYAYYKQSVKDPIKIGTAFIDPFMEWAWSEQEKFAPELFDAQYNSDIYLKYTVAQYFDAITPPVGFELPDPALQRELDMLRAINPHAIITTNYDRLPELVFDDYVSVVGQKILKSSSFTVGEIFKIHGCTSEPKSIVLTEADYEDFMNKKKYLSAKLLTFFAEHPLLLIGYSASDPNIQAILSDIDEIISEEADIIPNIFLLQWQESMEYSEYPQREQIIVLNNKKKVRIKCIVASEFEWVFRAFANNKPLESIHPKLLRALLSRTYDLVRCDIPRKRVEVDFATLEHALETDGDIAKLYGITTIGDATNVNAQFPYSLTQVAAKLGYTNWYHANQLIERIKNNEGVDLKANDNRYHIAVKSSTTTQTRKYSQEMVDLLQKMKDGEPFSILL